MSEVSTTSSTSPSEENSIEGLLDELANLPDPEDSDGDDGFGYDRRVTIEFPDEVSQLYCLRGLSIPIRDILEVITAKMPGLSRVLGEIRDNFFAGDDHDDYECQELIGHPGPSSLAVDEARAEVRVMLAAGAGERAMRREAVEDDLELEQRWALEDGIRQPANLGPLQNEVDELGREDEELAAFYESELDRFIRERTEWSEDRSMREAARRKELDAIRIRLDEARDVAFRQYLALFSKWHRLTYGRQEKGAPDAAA